MDENTPLSTSKTPRGLRRLSIFAAVLVIALLVGSWAILVNRTTRQSTFSSAAKSVSLKQNKDIYIGHNQVLYKLNGRTGAVIWQQHLKRSYPLDRRAASFFGVEVAEDVVYAAIDHDFSAFRSSDGKELWHQHIMPTASLTPEDLRIVGEEVEQGTLYLWHANSTVSSHSAQDGAPKWSNLVAEWGSVQYGTLYTKLWSDTQERSFLYALDAQTGKERWHFASPPLPGAGSIDPRVVDGIVYVGWGGYLYALNAQTGQQLWMYRLPQYHEFFQAQITNGVVYARSQYAFMEAPRDQIADATRVRAFNAKTGALLWTSGPDESLYSQVVPTGGDVIMTYHAVTKSSGTNDNNPSTADLNHAVTRSDGYSLNVITAKDARLLWQIQVPAGSGSVYPWVSMTDGRLYLFEGGKTPSLQTFDVHSGKKLGQHPLPIDPEKLVLSGVNNGIAYMLSAATGYYNETGDDSISAIRLSDGSLAWQMRLGALKNHEDALSALILAP
jgi:outer membrane protein assembly factor BamB